MKMEYLCRMCKIIPFRISRQVVSNAVRQLQYCVTERAALDCVELYASEQRRNSTGGYCRDAHKSYEREMSYQRKAESILNEENCFKVFIVCLNN